MGQKVERTSEQHFYMVPNLYNGMWIPGWWVEAHGALSKESAPATPMEVAISSRIFPALNLNELKALSIVLSKLQQKIVECDGDLEIVGEDRRRRIGAGSRGAGREIESAIQDLIGLRLLTPKDELPGDDYEGVPLFERNLRLKRQGEELSIALKLSDLGGEIIIGYGEPYSDLVRVDEGKASIKNVLGNMPPMSVWRSVWLDLQGNELSSFVELEKTMQWERRYLTFDGAFGCGLDQVIEKLASNSHKKERQTGNVKRVGFREKILHLERFGKKLLDHGIMCYEGGDRYLAFGPSSGQQMELVWERFTGHYLDEENSERLSQFAGYLYNKVFKPRADDVIGLMLRGGQHLTRCQVIQGVYSEIDKQFGADLANIVGIVSENLAMMAGPLLLEWGLRGSNMTAVPLPDEISIPMKDCISSFMSYGETAEKVGKFINFIGRNPETISRMLQHKMATIVTPDNREMLYAAVNGAEISKKHRGNAIVSDKVTETRAKTPERSSTKIPQDKKADVNFRKQVSDELSRIKDTQPERYRIIRQAYLDGLDQRAKRNISEFQKILQPHTFEQQLRNSLVKFLIANPSVFKE